MASRCIKSPMEHDVCIEDHPMGTNTMYVHRMGHAAMHMYQCAVKGGSTEKSVTWELHMHEENTVTFTQCVHVHMSVRGTVRSGSHILL